MCVSIKPHTRHRNKCPINEHNNTHSEKKRKNRFNFMFQCQHSQRFKLLSLTFIHSFIVQIYHEHIYLKSPCVSLHNSHKLHRLAFLFMGFEIERKTTPRIKEIRVHLKIKYNDSAVIYRAPFHGRQYWTEVNLTKSPFHFHCWLTSCRSVSICVNLNKLPLPLCL